MSWLEQPVGTWFCERHGDRGRLKVKEMACQPLTETWAISPWNLMGASWSSSADTISTTRPFCENGTQMKCAKTERPCLGEQRGNSFVLLKKKERKKGKEKQFRMVVEIKKKGQQNYPVQLTFRFSSFFFYCFLCRRYLFSVCISISGVSQMGSDFHMLSTQIWSTFLWWSPVFWVKYHSC